MSVSLYSDFKVYEPEFQAGYFEGVTQNIDVFNAASQGAITLATEQLGGHFEKQSFWASVAGAITRRDITSVAALTPDKLTQSEVIAVKLNRKFCIDVALDALRKIGTTDSEMSFSLGKVIGQERAKDYVNTGLIAVETAIEARTTDLNLDITGESTKTVTQAALARALAKFGDAAGMIKVWVMHSKPYFDLVQNAISDKIANVADVTIYQGTAPTLGRPCIVIDSPALTDANGSLTDTYNVLGLAAGALQVKETEAGQIVNQIITGLENLVARSQGEHAFNVGVKGAAYHTAAGANPTDTVLGTTTSWDAATSDPKLMAGVRLVVQ